MQTALFLIKISQFSSLIPVIIGLFFYKKLDKTFKSLVWFLLFFVIMNAEAGDGGVRKEKRSKGNKKGRGTRLRPSKMIKKSRV